MIDKQLLHQLFLTYVENKNIDEEFIGPIYQGVVNKLTQILEQRHLPVVINPRVCLGYIIEEHTYNISGVNQELINQVESDEEYKNNMITTVAEKVYFNEFLPYSAKSLISEYSPIISSFNFYLNFIANRILVLEPQNSVEQLILDMLTKAFLMCRGVMNLLTQGFETEAFSTWRTIHEIECVINIVYENPYVEPIYKKHIVYNRAFRDEFENKNEQQSVIDQLKSEMKSHDLKSKDMKKFIEYGWLYGIKDVEQKYPLLKLNFRNGLELVANLSEYSGLYEMSSEIAHSSPILIYSNKEYFKDITIVSMYETFLRLENIFYNILVNKKELDSAAFFKMREKYLSKLLLILGKEKSLFLSKNKNSL